MKGLQDRVNLHSQKIGCVRTSRVEIIVRCNKYVLTTTTGANEMPTGKLSHLQVNVRSTNLPFYQDLFTFLGWDPIYSDETTKSFNSLGDISIWFIGAANDARNDVDGVGVNHIALAAESQEEVDRLVAHLAERRIERLFETPRHRPDFSHSADDTYYQVMFSSPDGILFEHVYVGPKQD